MRALATSFGFTFGANSPQTTVSVPTAAPAFKRRKLDDQDNIRGTQQSSDARESEAASKHGGRTEARRRLEAIQEITVAETNMNTEEDSFVAIKKTTTARAISKARKQQPLALDSLPTVAEDNTSSRRPRRQAATRAIDQVSRGFIEEAQNVDKLRRGQDTVPPRQTSARKTTEVAETKLVREAGASHSSTKNSLPTSKPKGEAIEAAEPGKKMPRERPPKPKTVSQQGVADGTPDQCSIPTIARLPLAETTANPIMRSSSPEKLSKYSDDIIAPVHQRSPLRVRSPRKALEKSKNIAQGKRNPSKFTVSKDSPAANLEPDFVGVGTALKSEGVPRFSGTRSKSARQHNVALGQGEGRAIDDTATVKSKKKPRVKPTEVPRPAAEQHSSILKAAQSARPGRNGRAKTQEPKRDQEQGDTPKEEPTSTITASVEQPSDNDTDVDWLLTDRHKSKRTLAKRQARHVKRRLLKNTAELPDVDLDDLLSNIATYVPRNLEPTARVTGRR